MEFAIALFLVAAGWSPPVHANYLDTVEKSSPVIARSLAASADGEPGATIRVWVFFTDKRVADSADLAHRIAVRTADLPQRTLRRRALRGTNSQLVTIADLAVPDDYITGVVATGATLRRRSRWLNAVSVETTNAMLPAMAELPYVRCIQPVAHAAPREPIVEQTVPSAQAAPRGNGPAWYGASYDQLQQIGIVDAHNAGYNGAGVIVGILDTGFNRTHEAFNQTTNGAHPVQIITEHDYVSDDGDTTQQPGDPDEQSLHGTLILGTLAAYEPTVCVGGAFDASFILAKTEDISQEVPAEEDNYVAGLEWFESLGADMTTSSLGYIDWYTQADLDGATAVTTLAVNTAIADGLVCCTAAGNGGHDDDPMTSHLIAPADAQMVLTCGAVNDAGDIAGFSSDGPSADGRVKPEVLALGDHTKTVSFSSDTDIVSANGTSLATPLVASGVALILQAHPDWNADKIRRALFQTAGDFTANGTYDPLFIRGYGIINVYAAIQFVPGDINGDGAADGRDIQPFVDALLGTNPDANQVRRSDGNTNGAVELSDLGLFVEALLAS